MKRLALFGLLLISASAHSEVTLKMYTDAKATGGDVWKAIGSYFLGAGNAYGYANAHLDAQHKPQLFCVPPNLALKTQNFMDILAVALTRNPPTKENESIDIYLLSGLIFTFPCKT